MEAAVSRITRTQLCSIREYCRLHRLLVLCEVYCTYEDEVRLSFRELLSPFNYVAKVTRHDIANLTGHTLRQQLVMLMANVFSLRPPVRTFLAVVGVAILHLWVSAAEGACDLNAGQ